METYKRTSALSYEQFKEIHSMNYECFKLLPNEHKGEFKNLIAAMIETSFLDNSNQQLEIKLDCESAEEETIIVFINTRREATNDIRFYSSIDSRYKLNHLPTREEFEKAAGVSGSIIYKEEVHDEGIKELVDKQITDMETKTMELVKQYSTKDQVIVPSFTREHIPTGYHTLVKTNDDWELHSYHGMRFDEAFVISDEQLDTHWESLKDELKDTLNNYMGDDEFYDYFPDLYMSLQYVAMARSVKDGSGDEGFQNMMKPLRDKVVEYGPFPEEPDDDDWERLIDQCDELTMEMFRELNPNFGK